MKLEEISQNSIYIVILGKENDENKEISLRASKKLIQWIQNFKKFYYFQNTAT